MLGKTKKFQQNEHLAYRRIIMHNYGNWEVLSLSSMVPVQFPKSTFFCLFSFSGDVSAKTLCIK